MNYELTEAAMRVVTTASQSVARRFGGHFLQPEHLLLALLEAKGTLGQVALERSGADIDVPRSKLGAALPPRTRRDFLGDLPPSPRAKAVLNRATGEARLLEHRFIGTLHLLLACTREGESTLSAYFAEHSVTHELLGAPGEPRRAGPTSHDERWNGYSRPSVFGQGTSRHHPLHYLLVVEQCRSELLELGPRG